MESRGELPLALSSLLQRTETPWHQGLYNTTCHLLIGLPVFLIKILETEVLLDLTALEFQDPGRAYMLYSDHPQMGCRQFPEGFPTEPGKHMKQKGSYTGQGLR